MQSSQVQLDFLQLLRTSWAGWGSSSSASSARRHDLVEVFATLLAGDTVAKLEHSYTEVLQAIVDLVEARHPYTHGHSARVARLAVEIGQQMGLSPEGLRALHQAALLHDVGKVAVPDAVLDKPGPLTAEEFALVASHVVVGDQLLARIPQLGFARAAVRWHHERLDGSGYPDGLRGEAIPLEARIVAVADVYDALTTARPYRPALSPDDALAHLHQEAPRRYDPGVVAALTTTLARRGRAERGSETGPARPDTRATPPPPQAAPPRLPA